MTFRKKNSIPSKAKQNFAKKENFATRKTFENEEMKYVRVYDEKFAYISHLIHLYIMLH